MEGGGKGVGDVGWLRWLAEGIGMVEDEAEC